MTLLLCLTTVPDSKTAKKLSALWVERGHAACVSTIPGIQSTYRWKNKIESSKECLLLVKTTAAGAKKIRASLKKDHPYECPEWLELKTAGVLEAYARWVQGSVQ
ncbi:MAG: divalent-cation tolerance protein CutA [Planctomycetota bacterium]